MTDFPRSPRLTKGAIVSFDIFNFGLIPQAIQFQYNPDSLTRTLQGQTSGGEGNPLESFRLTGPPVESISLDIELDATDQLEHPDQNNVATRFGIHPQLAALEMILYPKSSVVVANTILAALGTIELIAPEGPFTLFIWGDKRVLPVRLTEFRVTEEAYDTNLNPIRAKVSLGLRVLSYMDFKLTHPGYYLFLSHQVVKEQMAFIGSINSIAAIGKEIYSRVKNV
jgi:hypothetical protein